LAVEERRGVTVGFAIHRPEMIPLLDAAMRGHATIVLEEPADPGFEEMLCGRLPVDEYLMNLEVEYPVFSRTMCGLLRERHAQGQRIVQVEPFIESLLEIHEFFAAGGTPAGLAKESLAHYVYRAERAATGALIAYYQAAASGTFEQATGAVIRFARADAARLRLRDSLRAQALAALLPPDAPSAFVEAGVIHLLLYQELRRLLPPGIRVRALFLARTAMRAIGARGPLTGPGDLLTFRYLFHPPQGEAPCDWERLQAARAMIYSKILEKEEQAAGPGAFPHLRDELACIAAVRRLSLDQCRDLFPRLRRMGSRGARGILAQFAGA
jgi:hypothetical protein